MSELKKQTTSSTTGLLVGLMFGFLIGLAMFKQTPKSERSDAFPYLTGLGLILCTVAGYKVGKFNDDQNYRDEFLGINNIQTNYHKDENGWAIQTQWTEYPDKENSLVTTILEGEMVTIFNGLVLINHQNSGNSRSASKLHEEVKNDIVQRLKDGFVG
nr:hypothetical protein [uncultured Pedobacter sp.]